MVGANLHSVNLVAVELSFVRNGTNDIAGLHAMAVSNREAIGNLQPIVLKRIVGARRNTT